MAKPTILLVEDNLGDQRLVREAFGKTKIDADLQIVCDGVEALDYLKRRGEFKHAARPQLIILDLNVPKKDGREVLGEIKGDPGLKRIPVVVFTTSKSTEDISRCYDLHANCFISKPADLDEFFSGIQALADFWFRVVELPQV